MTITLSVIEVSNIWLRAAVLAVVAVGLTIVVYGSVALLVKVDDVGLYLSKVGRLQATRSIGRWLVIAMPSVLKVISIIGTAAMLWVGGNIVLHSLHELHLSLPYETIKDVAYAVSSGGQNGVVSWLVTAFLDAVVGLVLGLLLIPMVHAFLVPIGMLFPEKNQSPSRSE